MSSIKRVISGASASWLSMFVNIAAQLILVPIYLKYWSLNEFGIWMALQALVNVLSTLDRGHNDYLEYEFLKLGLKNREEIARILSSSAVLVLFISFIEMLLFLTFFYLFKLGGWDFSNLKFFDGMIDAFVCLWIAWSITNFTGLLFRSLSAFGHFPRMSWWSFLTTCVNVVLPVFIVINNGSLTDVSRYLAIASVLIFIVQLIDLKKLLAKELPFFKLTFTLNTAFSKYIHSLKLSARYFLDNFKQQGIRLMILPIAGPVTLANFATIRTLANVAQQGLLTITHPILPELMRYLGERNQKKMEYSFLTVWVVLMAVMAPGVIVLQLVAPHLFQFWTRGIINFDSRLFALLSMSVLVFALAQPAIAVIVGNNLLSKQLLISIISIGILLILFLILLPDIGILATGFGLLGAELFSAIGCIAVTISLLKHMQLKWPMSIFYYVVFSIILAAAGLITIIYMENKIFCALISIALLFTNLGALAFKLFAKDSQPIIQSIFKR